MTDIYTVVLLLTHDPKSLDMLVRRLRQALGRRDRSSELKAAQSNSTVIRRLLAKLAETESEIYVTVVDKRYTKRSQRQQREQAVRETIVHLSRKRQCGESK